ncbi:hypothetical protein C5E45_15050 [Nocardia nova]|uniref:DUF4334 domain-containing protein n=1 Tax=Nocardia nova TaxID=37330 RepID=A0A2S6AQB7_9NOCA|nr:DUF4334 domain-containing protein [Nocardia nova]PPJ26636.1 hypothetical protein C5E41_17740 [Nocardia nova]PPJ37435.1 hypothetical protein C5E45_15050 [Nocardia nova]
MNITEARTRFSELRAGGGAASSQELDEIWSALDTVRPEQILGQWKGDEFDNGHPMCGKLGPAGWYGKTFAAIKDAKPLVMRDKNGELYSATELGNGEASLWMVEFRGEVTATMVYDGRPIFDHFKRVDENTLMGCMNGKDLPGETFGFTEDGPMYYFLLERA